MRGIPDKPHLAMDFSVILTFGQGPASYRGWFKIKTFFVAGMRDMEDGFGAVAVTVRRTVRISRVGTDNLKSVSGKRRWRRFFDN